MKVECMSNYKDITVKKSYTVLEEVGDNWRIKNDAGKRLKYPKALFILLPEEEAIEVVEEPVIVTNEESYEESVVQEVIEKTPRKSKKKDKEEEIEILVEVEQETLTEENIG